MYSILNIYVAYISWNQIEIGTYDLMSFDFFISLALNKRIRKMRQRTQTNVLQ